MLHKKAILSVVLLLGIALAGLQAQTLFVKEKGGTLSSLALNHVRKLSFAEGNLTVNKTVGSSGIYAISNIRYLSFTNYSTSISEQKLQQSNGILLYPNPVVDLLNIQLLTKGSNAYVMEILSIEGRVVYKEKINPQDDVYQINVSALPNGLYLCKINNGITTETTKFLKQ